MVAISDLAGPGLRRTRHALALAVLMAMGSGALLTAAPAAALGGELVAASPGNGAILTRSPRAVVLTFSARPDLLSWLTVTGPTGLVSTGAPSISGTTMSRALPAALPNGAYRVTYSAHFGFLGGLAIGAGTFTVAAPTVTAPTRSSAPRTGASRPGPTRTRRTTAPGSGGGSTTPGTDASAGTGSSDPPATTGKPSSSRASGSVLAAPGPARTTPAAETTPPSGLPSPPPLVWIALALALAGFAANRFRGARRPRRGRIVLPPAARSRLRDARGRLRDPRRPRR